MMKIDDIRKPIVADIEAFERFLKDKFTAESKPMQEMLNYALNTRGKCLRSMLAMLCAGLYSPAPKATAEECGAQRNCSTRTYVAAMLVEMIHTASLIHDDIIDMADERRGVPSVRARFRNDMAVLVGDFILARAMDLGMSSAQYDLMSHVGKAMATLCEGEVLQDVHTRKADTTREDYLDIIYRKTASLLGTSAALGAMSAGAKHEDVERARKFGETIGIAFQIKDDILDYVGDDKLGKQRLNDLKESKITLPLIEIMDNEYASCPEEIIILLHRCRKDNAAVERLHAIVRENKGVERATETMVAYISRAMSLLNDMPDNPYREALMNLCLYVGDREL